MVGRRASRPWVALVFLLLGVGALLVPAVPALGSPSPSPTIQGSVDGPSVVATSSNSTFYINGTGGPAFGANGTEIGSVSWKAHLSGTVLTGVTLSPNSSTFSGSKPGVSHLKVSKLVQSLTITVEITSTYQTKVASINVTKTIQVVVPYVVRAQLSVGPGAGVLGFDVTVALDGAPVGTVAVPAIKAGGTYNLTYAYATAGLSAGSHTFTLSLKSASALVTFPGGARQYSVTIYVVGPPPDYPLYVLLGVVVFAGVLFIFVTRVGARRRLAASKK